MDHLGQAREFLTACRGRVRPAQVGLPEFGERRVPGLRREEVAALAGVSVHYYTRMERGDLSGASAGVLAAVSRALLLDDAEREYLLNLAGRASARTRRPPGRPRASVPASLLHMLDAMTDAPADVRSYQRDILGANPLGRALYWPMYDGPLGIPNAARYTFLDAGAQEFFCDWERTADDTVASLRAETARHPDDRELSQLIDDLVTGSDAFACRWADQRVRHHNSGVKRLRHPLVGELTLDFHVLALPGHPELGVLVHSAAPRSASQDALRFLASWAYDQSPTGARPDDRSPTRRPKSDPTTEARPDDRGPTMT